MGQPAPRFDMSAETVLLGFDFINALSNDIVEMRKRWNRQRIDWKISPIGVDESAHIDSLDELCEAIECVLPVVQAAKG